MGNYNPNIPNIIGQEWVPIRNEDTTFIANQTVAEVGYSFLNGSAAQTLQDARMYLSEWPEGVTNGQYFGISVYPAGTEHETGPINSVIIPANSVGLTGNGGDLPSTTDFLNAITNPTDAASINSGYVGGTPTAFRAEIYFDVNRYSQLLNGKRILGVDLLYSLNTLGDPSELSSWTKQLSIGVSRSLPATFLAVASISALGVGTLPFSTTSGVRTVYPLQMGEVSPVTVFSSPLNPLTWTYGELQRFEATNADRMAIDFRSSTDASHQSFFVIDYLALRVFYCEEKRVANGIFVAQSNNLLSLNTLTIPMRVPTTNALSPVIQANTNYTVAMRAADAGQSATGINAATTVNWAALRQLYSIPSHPGIQINHPYPMDEQAVGQEFTVETTDVLPQVTLHTSTGTVVSVHPYGRQAIAQVYGTVTATQQIDDTSPAITGYSYPQVRFYARRWGDTAVPLNIFRSSNPAQLTSITPEAFDALPPEGGILDGWKEVTLRFPSASIPQFGPTGAQYTWSAPGETAGNRWEILGAYAPALSGTPGNMINQINPATQRLGPATYGAPISGSTVELVWVPGWSPLVSSATADPAADAMLIFSQDPMTITGFTLSTKNQAISGIGLDCGGAPCCIPTGISFHEITWGAGATSDSFSDDAMGDWGVADNGQAWVGDVGAFVSGGIAWNAFQTGNSGLQNVVFTGLNDAEMYYEVFAPAMVTGGAYYPSAMLRWGAGDSYYMGDVIFRSGGLLNASITRRTAAGFTTIASERFVSFYGPNRWISVKFQVSGIQIRLKAWQKGTLEPDWQITVYDTTIVNGLYAGMRTEFDGTTGPSPVSIGYDNFCVYPAMMSNGGYWELQRSDTITDWKTIMRGDPCSWRFRDYEARVGVNSFYRIRMVNAYNFAGLWSTTITGMIPSPGVTGSSCLQLSSDTRTLIFTSNYNQDGTYNLAYVPVWDNGKPSEDFAFPEAGTVSFGRMYNRNYQVGFKPTERGGEVFSRNILVNAAAVSLPRLANVKSLRDMAWQDVPYICVRDNLGDRWFAFVQVPNERVQRNGRLYIAQVGITEVTDTPYPVNP